MSEYVKGNYSLPDTNLNRSSSEPDVFLSSQNIRQRTCSNSSNYGSLQRRRKASSSKVSGTVDKTAPSITEVTQMMNSSEHSSYDNKEEK